MGNIKRSPIFYMGNKYKLLNQLLPLFPKKVNNFYDLFGGSGVVSLNINADNILYNEINENIVELVKMFKENNPEDLDEYFKKKIKEYNLEQCSIKAKDRVNKIVYERRKQSYNKLRNDYNNSTNKEYKDLFLLSCYSINHLIRFNRNNQFNASSGADSYNEKNYNQILNFHDIFNNIKITCDDYQNIKIIKDKNTFVYCDPPYSNTEAVYNEKRAFGGWNENKDIELFNYLIELDKKGIKWGLSNVFENRGKKNEHLIKWCEDNNWNVYHLNRNYNPFSRGNSNNDEVYICNYNKKLR